MMRDVLDGLLKLPHMKLIEKEKHDTRIFKKVTKTVKHHHLRKQGFPEELKQFPGQFVPYSTQVRGFENTVTSVGLNILRHFRHSTTFLKVSCEGNFLLPIVVGKVAVERLLDSVDEDDHGVLFSHSVSVFPFLLKPGGLMDYLNHFQFAKKLVIDLGYEIKMVKITKRVINTYFTTIYFGKCYQRRWLLHAMVACD